MTMNKKKTLNIFLLHSAWLQLSHHPAVCSGRLCRGWQGFPAWPSTSPQVFWKVVHHFILPPDHQKNQGNTFKLKLTNLVDCLYVVTCPVFTEAAQHCTAVQILKFTHSTNIAGIQAGGDHITGRQMCHRQCFHNTWLMWPSLRTAQERSDTDSLMDDQTAGVDNTHVGFPVSGGQARDGLTACRPPVSTSLLSEPSPLSGWGQAPAPAGWGWHSLPCWNCCQTWHTVHPSVDFYR